MKKNKTNIEIETPFVTFSEDYHDFNKILKVLSENSHQNSIVYLEFVLPLAQRTMERYYGAIFYVKEQEQEAQTKLRSLKGHQI